MALVGNPNVGKSAIFNRLTGSQSITANYPGKTVEIVTASLSSDRNVLLVDLPGTYSIFGVSEDQWVTQRFLLEERPDVVVVILDATKLEHNLYQVLQLQDLGFKLIIALNLIDEAQKLGFGVDAQSLGKMTGTTVVETVAIEGRGIDELSHAISSALREPADALAHPCYGEELESSLVQIGGLLRAPEGSLSKRSAAILVLEGNESSPLKASFTQAELDGLSMSLVHARQILVSEMASAVLTRVHVKERAIDRLNDILVSPLTGLPILTLVLLSIFSFVFFAGGVLSELLSSGWDAFVSPVLGATFTFLAGDGLITHILIWGLDAGILAVLAVGIPYVLTFYLILGFLEDSGYLNSTAFLLDRSMRRLGLNGRAAIPLIAGFGCNVPAILGTRVLESKRQRLIASSLIVLTPCSARSAIIFGAVGLYVGFLPALGIYGLVAGLTLLLGSTLDKTLPGRSRGLLMEVFPLRKPSMPDLLSKTLFRFKSFVFVALPIVLLGSFVLGALYETGTIWSLADPLSPLFVGWLGLPTVAGLALIFAVLRKELALQLLVALAAIQFGLGAESLSFFMTPLQIIVYTIVATIYIPCIATIAVLMKEMGWKFAVALSIGMIGLAFLVGGVALRILIIL